MAMGARTRIAAARPPLGTTARLAAGRALRPALRLAPQLALCPLAVCLLTLPFLAGTAAAQDPPAPVISHQDGLLLAAFAAPEGTVTVLLPDDVAAGEQVTGSVEGPPGLVVEFGSERASTGGTFVWRFPSGEEPVALVLRAAGGEVRGQVRLRAPEGGARPSTFRLPGLVQAGALFPVFGPFDGDRASTRVTVGGEAGTVVAESVRRAIVRAPSGVEGVASAEIVDGTGRHTGTLRSLDVRLEAASGDTRGATHVLTVSGLTGFAGDVPLQVGSQHFYIKADEVAPSGVFSVQRTFPGMAGASAGASLLIPQTPLDEVAIVLRTPRRAPGTALPDQHASALRRLPFDPLPVAMDLFGDPDLESDAAYAMLAMDEARALALMFESIPESGATVQIIALNRFVQRHDGLGTVVNAEAHAAALRALDHRFSTATSELAIYVLGLTGTDADVPVLDRIHRSGGLDAGRLRDASEAALARLGSTSHVERIGAALATPVGPNARYEDGVVLSTQLWKAAFSGRAELVPLVCGHLEAPVLSNREATVDPAAMARTALAAIVDGQTPVPDMVSRRSAAEWRAHCDAVRTTP